jgi:hypothetical protein
MSLEDSICALHSMHLSFYYSGRIILLREPYNFRRRCKTTLLPTIAMGWLINNSEKAHQAAWT